MSHLLRSCTRVAALLLVAFAMVATAQAVTGDYFSSFGRVFNDTTPKATGGECVAASFINGATYLKNHYPATYGSTDITKGGTGSSTTAMQNFGSYGWTYGGKSYNGYYPRCSSDGNTAVFGDMWQTTIDWMDNCYAPGKTIFTGQAWTARSGNENTSLWPYGYNVTSCAPTYDFMHDAVAADKFVELCIYSYSVDGNGKVTFGQGHAVNLLDITSNSIKFQDPNLPLVTYSSSLSTVSAWDTSALSFYDSFTFGSTPVMILTAFALAPVPEPSTIALLLLAILGGLLWRRRKR